MPLRRCANLCLKFLFEGFVVSQFILLPNFQGSYSFIQNLLFCFKQNKCVEKEKELISPWTDISLLKIFLETNSYYFKRILLLIFLIPPGVKYVDFMWKFQFAYPYELNLHRSDERNHFVKHKQSFQAIGFFFAHYYCSINEFFRIFFSQNFCYIRSAEVLSCCFVLQADENLVFHIIGLLLSFEQFEKFNAPARKFWPFSYLWSVVSKAVLSTISLVLLIPSLGRKLVLAGCPHKLHLPCFFSSSFHHFSLWTANVAFVCFAVYLSTVT